MSFLAGLGGFGAGYAEGAQQAQQRRMQELYQQQLIDSMQGQQGAYQAALLDQGPGALSTMPGQASQGAPGGAVPGGPQVMPGAAPIAPQGFQAGPAMPPGASLSTVRPQQGVDVTPGLPLGGPRMASADPGLGIPSSSPGMMGGPSLPPSGYQPQPPGGWAPDLGSVRRQLMQRSPQAAQRLMQLTEAEVGGQGPQAAQAFMESVFNRAAARGQTLDQAMNDAGYYPRVSLVGKTPSDPQMYSQVLGSVLQGSNLSKRATGNASGTVGFAGGPQTYSPGTGERFGIEGPDRAWAKGEAKPGSPEDIGRLDPQSMQLAQAQGYGPLTVGQAARRVERVMPNASFNAKFQALQKLYQMMNQQDQMQFNRFMQWHTYQRQEEAAGRAQEAQRLQQLKSDPDYHGLSGSIAAQQKKISMLDEFSNTTVAFGNRLLQLAKQKSASGVPVIQAWIDAGRRATGDPLVKQFDAQLRGYTTDMAQLLGKMTGVLTDSARHEAMALIPEGATYDQIEAVVNTLRQDVITRKQEASKIFNRDRQRAAKIREQYGVKSVPFEEEEPSPTPEFAPAAPAAPAGGIPPGVKITPIQ